MDIENTEVVFKYISPQFTEEKWCDAGSFVAVVLGYNHESCIDSAIKSALSQDYPCYEIFIMDDCSTDLTLKVMLDTVKSQVLESLPVRIIVTKNQVNQSACKQWYAASQLSHGQWFAMFCGDDISLPNRLKDVADVVRRYPTSVGVFTNFYKNSSKDLYHTRFLDERVWNGDETEPPLLWPYGCAAAWHRTLLEIPFEKHNIDDYIIMWRAISMRIHSHVPTLIWAMDKVTVSYSNDTGVTNKLLFNDECANRNSWLSRHLSIARARYKRSKAEKTMLQIARRFDSAYGKDSILRRYLHFLQIESDLYSGGFIRPIIAAFRIVFTSDKNGFDNYKSHVIWNLKHIFPVFYLRYCLGLFSCVVIDSVCEISKGTRYR